MDDDDETERALAEIQRYNRAQRILNIAYGIVRAEMRRIENGETSPEED